jgi:hypothetical protein
MSSLPHGPCPLCQEAGQTSIVRTDCVITTTMTADHFTDEAGAFHCHDPNVTISHYRCSRDHSWSEQRYHSCGCGWSGDRASAP